MTAISQGAGKINWEYSVLSMLHMQCYSTTCGFILV